MGTIALLGSTLGLGLVAGVRLYAAVLAVGLGLRLGILHLNPGLERLSVLASPYVLIPAAIAYAAEFLADKIPWVDSAWDFVHTLIRPLGAALIAAAALGSVDKTAMVTAAVLSGGVGLLGHTAKAGTRLIVNHSPEPFSNIGLSLAEDGFVAAGAWMAIEHPLIMLGIVAAFVAVFLWVVPKIFRAIRGAWRTVFYSAAAVRERSVTEPRP